MSVAQNGTSHKLSAALLKRQKQVLVQSPNRELVANGNFNAPSPDQVFNQVKFVRPEQREVDVQRGDSYFSN